MTIKTTYSSTQRANLGDGDRFVRWCPHDLCYRWCIRAAKEHQYDVAQGTCDAEDLPPDVRAAADANQTVHYVSWPRQ